MAFAGQQSCHRFTGKINLAVLQYTLQNLKRPFFYISTLISSYTKHMFYNSNKHTNIGHHHLYHCLNLRSKTYSEAWSSWQNSNFHMKSNRKHEDNEVRQVATQKNSAKGKDPSIFRGRLKKERTVNTLRSYRAPCTCLY